MLNDSTTHIPFLFISGALVLTLPIVKMCLFTDKRPQHHLGSVVPGMPLEPYALPLSLLLGQILPT